MNSVIIKQKTKVNTLYVFKEFLRYSIGLLFIISAILKLISIDYFELYIYSFNIFNYSVSAIAARFIISFELIAGLLFVFRFYYRHTWYLILIATIGFTLLLIYIAYYRNDSNCHCMGALVELNPQLSIIKNIIIIASLVFIKNSKESTYIRKRIFAVIFSVLLVILPYILYPTDELYRVLTNTNISIDSKAFDQAISDTVMNTYISDIIIDDNTQVSYKTEKSKLQINNGTYLICFVHSSCSHCEVAINKISLIFENHKLDYSKCIMLIWGDYDHICNFIETTDSENFHFRIIDPVNAVKITKGKFPTIALFENGAVSQVFNSRSIDEKSIVSLLN
jgi:uncharacterized membrane protein YphA (DoxX/SURF4 family)